MSGNIISNVQSMANASATGAIEVAVGSGTIELNKITTVHNRFAGNLGVYAINIAGGSNTTIRNNFVSDVKMDMSFSFSPNFGTSTGIHAIRLASGTGHKVYHNSVNLSGTLFGTSTLNILTTAVTIASTSVTGADVRNNIFSNTLTGGPSGSAHVSLFLPSGASATLNLTLNNNAYFCGGSVSQVKDDRDVEARHLGGPGRAQAALEVLRQGPARGRGGHCPAPSRRGRQARRGIRDRRVVTQIAKRVQEAEPSRASGRGRSAAPPPRRCSGRRRSAGRWSSLWTTWSITSGAFRSRQILGLPLPQDLGDGVIPGWVERSFGPGSAPAGRA